MLSSAISSFSALRSTNSITSRTSLVFNSCIVFSPEYNRFGSNTKRKCFSAQPPVGPFYCSALTLALFGHTIPARSLRGQGANHRPARMAPQVGDLLLFEMPTTRYLRFENIDIKQPEISAWCSQCGQSFKGIPQPTELVNEVLLRIRREFDAHDCDLPTASK